MKKYSVRIPPEVETTLRHLFPSLKTKIRHALEMIGYDPHIGKALKDPLKGLWSYRVGRFRIIYQINHHEIWVEVIEVAERKIVYEKVAEAFRIWKREK